VSECVGRRSATAGRTPTQNAPVRRSVHTATPDKTRLPRLPVDRRRRDAGQAGSYGYPPDRPHAATLCATQNVNTLWTAAYD